MKSTDEIIDLIQKHKDEYQKQYGLLKIGIFGSYARGEQNNASDVDLLIELEKPIGLVRFMRLERSLSDLLGVRVDLVMPKALKPHIGERILREVRDV